MHTNKATLALKLGINSTQNTIKTHTCNMHKTNVSSELKIRTE